jgi:predicted signal transduction protein with EAL and GGDEF domain
LATSHYYFHDFATDLETLQNQADQALYQAKENGRNTFCTFADIDEQTKSEGSNIASDLSPAIDS